MTRMILRAAPLALVLLAISCGKSTVTVTQIAPGAQCAAGGISIVVDGAAPEIVCNGTDGTNGTNGLDGGKGNNGTNGTDGFTTLVKTTTLAVGDTNCPSGGQRIDSGLDNGANGGTANDGILQAGEILSTSYVCNGTTENIGSIAPPSGTPGDSTIMAVGGNSDGGNGGSGGPIVIGFENGSIGGHVKIFKTGAADPTFTFPAKPAVDLGATPAIVTADTTIAFLDPTETDAGDGTYYLNANNQLAVLDADGGSSIVTGLSIAAGVTVTVTPTSGSDPTNFTVNGAIMNAGTISLANVGVSIRLDISANAYFGDITSAVLNNGVDDFTSPNVRSLADPGPHGTDSGGIILSASPIWNEGLISANGGSGAYGGSGGNIEIDGRGGNETPMFNTGIIEAKGGTGSNGAGGSGGSVYLYGYLDVNNSGPINTSGGAGTTAGGTAGEIGLYGGDEVAAPLRNSGTLTAKGGDVSASCVQSDGVSCAAGNGSRIEVYAYGGALTNNAAITTAGGSSPGGTGGTGAPVIVVISAAEDAPVSGNGGVVSPGDLLFSGSVNSSGGFGGIAGGSAGQVDIRFDNYFQPNGQEIILYGFAQLNSSGGAGSTYGGNGAYMDLINNYYQAGSCNECRAIRSAQVNNTGYGPGGSVINYSDLVAKGGNGGSGAGGLGGEMNLSTQSSYYFSGDVFEQVINAGNIDISGGDGATGGNGATMTLYGLTGVTNSGILTSRGGTGLVGQGGFGGGSFIHIGSDNGDVTNSATIDASGGAGVSAGGNAGAVAMLGMKATDSGEIVAAGGDASGAESSGGNGGSFWIQSTSGASSVTVAAPAGINVSGGTAPQSGTPGSEGQVNVDGWNQTSSWTH